MLIDLKFIKEFILGLDYLLKIIIYYIIVIYELLISLNKGSKKCKYL